MSSSYQNNPMERVLYNLHHQVCTAALRRTSTRSRSLFEYTLLIGAVCGFGALLLAHLSFVYRGATTSRSLDTTGRPTRNIPSACLQSISGFSRDADITHLSLIDGDSSGQSSQAFQSVNECEAATPDSATVGSCIDLDSIEILYSHSNVKGYLLLPAEVYAPHHISVQHVLVSKTDERCFGEPFLQQLIFRLLAPDSVMVNWLLAAYNAKGFVYDRRTQTMMDLSQFGSSSTTATEHRTTSDSNTPWYWQLGSKLTVVLKTSFLYFITTTLVSFTLRESQERMLDFTHQLQAHVRSRRPVVHIVIMHIAENLVFVPIMVGMIFFLIEFYRGDKFLAFMVLSVVWLCEVFSVVSLRSSQGIHFFPRIFFLLFAIFHFYVFSFPFGFSYTALASTVCFMVHSMLFFWQRYELPAVALGHVTMENPRMGLSPFPNGVPTLHQDANVNGHRQHEQPPVPSVALPPRLTATTGPQMLRNHSQHSAMSSLGRVSRQNSSGLFHLGNGDDESSYMVFMDGEVVMRNQRPPSPLVSPGANGSTDGSVSGGAVSMEGSGSNHDTTRGMPDRVDVLHASDAVDVDNFETPRPSPSRAAETTQNNNHISDPPEVSALQAILDVHTTPRTDNLSNRSNGTSTQEDNDEEARVATAPSFPLLSCVDRQLSTDTDVSAL